MFIGLSILGCATRPIHSVTIFAIQGQVFDRESNFPLAMVDVYFIDTGYDDNRSRNPTPIKVAQSDSKGKIEARLNYVWSRKKSPISNLPKATFDIILSRDRYQTRRYQFKESELQTDRVSFLVNLEEVYMVRKLK